MYAIDLFAGAGGMSAGAAEAGINVGYAVEIDKYAAETYQHNHPGTILLQEDVRSISVDSFSIASNKADIVFGGPPCQGFSTSNQKTRTSRNPNNWLFNEYFRIVEEIEPSWVVFENVKGLLETEKGFFFREVTNELSKLGYKVSSFVLNAVNYGIPQCRERLFIIGSKKGKTITEPPVKRGKQVTVHGALSDLPDLKNGASIDYLPYKGDAKSAYQRKMRKSLKQCGNHLVTKNSPVILDRYKFVAQGGNWEDIPSELMKNYTDRTRCHTGIYHRLRPDTPSIVVGNYRKNMLIHPNEHRGLSVREAARLQSFRDNYRFIGSIGFQQQQVGNAVPPLLAKSLFDHIVKYDG